jgi:hypothetical protein
MPRAFIHEMRQRGLWQEFEQWVAEAVDFFNKRRDKAQAISKLHGMLVTMRTQYEKTLPKEDLDILIFQELKFIVPTCASPPSRHTPMVFDRCSKDLMSLIHTDMTSSVVYRKLPGKSESSQYVAAEPEGPEGQTPDPPQPTACGRRSRGQRGRGSTKKTDSVGGTQARGQGNKVLAAIH